ncbi:MAG TPA: hypothetical protein VJ625_10695 [Propionibacteriaceae bacterium]|nr:hypothetical protein [Propionibacteriaceae bacterium]
MPTNRDTILLETVRTHRARLLSAFLYGELAERRLGQDNLKRLLGSVVLAAVICTGCVGFSLVTSLIASQAAKQAQQRAGGSSTPGISDQPYAADYFDRSDGRGWGSAEVGGRWTTRGSSSDYLVSDGVGIMRVSPGEVRGAFLNRASRETADVSATVRMNTLTATVVVVGRKVKGDDYRAVIKFSGRGALSVFLEAQQAGEAVPLSNTVSLIGKYQEGEEIKIKLQVFGVNPTVLRAKVWRAAEVEPPAWSVTAQDGFDRLQRSGVVGIMASRPSNELDPLRLAVLDFVARPVIG